MSNFSIYDLIEISSKADNNLKWFLEKHDMLIENYQGKYVAIENEGVIDSDNNIINLLQKLQANSKHSNSTIIQYVNDRNVELTVH